MYGDFAAWYDKMMRTADYDVWADYLDSFLREQDARAVLEAGCGTGSIACRLAKKGYSLIASDISEDMLMAARSKMMAAGLRFPILCQDMNALSVHKPVDAVISVCDGVNYLPDGPERFFTAAWRCLKPGGLLLFDISSEYKLSHTLASCSFSDSDAEWAYICDCSFDAADRTLLMELTCFVQQGKLFRRFFETHRQQAYSAEELRNALTGSGFIDINTYSCFTRSMPEADSERIQFTARKPYREADL